MIKQGVEVEVLMVFFILHCKGNDVDLCFGITHRHDKSGLFCHFVFFVVLSYFQNSICVSKFQHVIEMSQCNLQLTL